MNGDVPAYGLWFLAVVNAAVFILFAFSFFKPRTARDWRSLGAFSAFIVALFVEMYGFPLTLYLLAGWAGSRFPALDPLSHDAGHLWPALFGWTMDPHLSPFHLLSFVLIGGGFLLIAAAWRAARGPAGRPAGDDRTVRPPAASPICRVRPDRDRLLPAMAHAGDRPDAAGSARDVLASGPARGARGRTDLRGEVSRLCQARVPAFFPWRIPALGENAG